MLRRIATLVLLLLLACVAWLLFAPVQVEPVAWEPPPDPGYTGAFAPNTRLAGMERLALGIDHGPEDVAVDDSGRVYAAVESGFVVRFTPGDSAVERWAHTGGRPAGIDFDAAGNLIVADVLRGLLSISREGIVSVLATSGADGVPIGLADDVDVAADGRIWFTDASTKFSPREFGLEAAFTMDLLEHGGHGRLMVYDTTTKQARTVVAGLDFANGVALAHDQRSVLVNETGSYRVLRVPTDSAWRGEPEVLLDGLPAFPDNISQGRDGRYWVALVAPRDATLDRLARWPFLRKMVQRLPAALRPQGRAYGHVIAIDDAGRVLLDLQDPDGAHPMVTSAVETGTHVYFGSLVSPFVGRLTRRAAGLAGEP